MPGEGGVMTWDYRIVKTNWASEKTSLGEEHLRDSEKWSRSNSKLSLKFILGQRYLIIAFQENAKMEGEADDTGQKRPNKEASYVENGSWPTEASKGVFWHEINEVLIT